MADLNDAVWQRDQSSYGDGFVAGFYLYRRAGRVGLPVRVWFGAPVGPDGDEEDRSHRWQVSIAGVRLDDERIDPRWTMARLEDVWPRCLREPIDKAEYDFLIARIGHAREHRPYDPFADTKGRINDLNFQLPWD